MTATELLHKLCLVSLPALLVPHRLKVHATLDRQVQDRLLQIVPAK